MPKPTPSKPAVPAPTPPPPPNYATATDGTALIHHDPWLEPYQHQLRSRFAHYQRTLAKINETGGLLGPISQGHHYFGFTRGTRGDDRSPGRQSGDLADPNELGVWYREWAPAAHSLRLIGDFNNWDRAANPLTPDGFGVWSTFLPDREYAHRLLHTSRVKVHVVTDRGAMDRIPAYIRRTIQEPGTVNFTGIFWMPQDDFAFQHPAPPKPDPTHPAKTPGLRIYEAHVGMATEHEKVGTYDEFTRDILPRVKSLGYNAIQLMAVQEHPYYGSFGYHVSNFFAVASRFGTPTDLKLLIDRAHALGLLVIMDLVHSHAVKNTHEGLNRFDGSDFQYFHAPPRGHHVAWDSLLFDYSKYEVQRFLLSNVRYWLEEYRFDGFRFDGVTSMLYMDHGLGKSFSSYDDYFGPNVDDDAVTYLMLANQLAHSLPPAPVGSASADASSNRQSALDIRHSPTQHSALSTQHSNIITIAEDVSGMVGTARPVPEGGLGFDYRLSMGVPDYWIKLVKEKKDEDWNLGDLFTTLLNRRRTEPHVGYAESHDQALVGDKTLAFWLMDQEMYWKMDNTSQSHVIDRGIALHKMIRLLTFSLSGEGYLTFMGNEFGHPEWVDFPREGNNWSYQHARRQWSLADSPFLRYQGLQNFDRAMLALDDQYHLLTDPFIEQLWVHEDNKQLVYRRGPLVFVFNFHPTNSYSNWRIPIPDPTDYKTVLNTDKKEFSGPGLVTDPEKFIYQPQEFHGRPQSLQLYLPARSAQVLAPTRLAR